MISNANVVVDQQEETFTKPPSATSLVTNIAPGIPNGGNPSGSGSGSGLVESTEQAQQNPLYILVICRLEKLATDLQQIIKYASIIGQEFDSTTLEAILPKQFIAGIQNSLELLLESSFILSMDTDDTMPTFCFQNYLIRNALYGLTPPSEAAKIHIRIALYIERTFASNLRNYYYK